MGEQPRFEVKEFQAGDGYVWRYRHYVPDSQPAARVVFLHGIQSHAGWYGHSCERLRQAGYDVSFLERRGSGMNQKDRGDTPSFRRLLDDIAEFLGPLRSDVQDRSPVPIILGAISWGGKLALALQRRHPGLVDGIALLCPGLFPKVTPPFGDRFRIVRSYFFSPRKLFPIPLNEPELFTTNPERVEFLRGDPLALREATARFLVHSVRLDAYLRLCPKYVREPVLLLLAEKDRIIDNARTRAYVENFRAEDKTIIEYPGAHHTLEFEAEPDGFINDLLNWIGRIARPKEPAGTS